MRVLNVIVDFLIEHRKAIGNIIVVIGTYYSWVVLVKTITLAWHTVIGIGKAVFTAYRTALILGRIAVIGFTQGVGAATHAMRIFNTVVKANPFGLILSVIAAVVIAIKSLIDRTSEYTKKMREARNKAATYTEELQKEMRTIDTLMGKLEAAKKGTKEYKNVKDEIIKQYGKYLKGLINERGEITNLTEAYKLLCRRCAYRGKGAVYSDSP